jgi:hypothetical protein
MKNLLMALILTVSVTIGTSHKAQAGIILLPASTIGGIALIAIGAPVAGVAGLIAIIADSAGSLDNALGGGIIALAGIALIVLDEDMDTNNQVSLGLEAKYPMINDKSIFDDIAFMIEDKVSTLKESDKEVKIKLDESQVRSILERLDSTGIENNIEKLVSDLI